jgi:DNA adenine methylase
MTLLPGLAELLNPTAAEVEAEIAALPAVASPIVKWVGGKTRLLDSIVARVPRPHGRYYEPFAGGAALFFALGPPRAVLNDANADLIEMYRTVARDVEAVIQLLAMYQRDHGETQYYGTRTLFNENALSPVQRAAAFIYLNKTCFNGLWRVNRKGEFNVPMGDYKNPTICNPGALRAAARVLARAELRAGGYIEAVHDVRRGDFVYFDPPYHDTFASYTSGSFGEAEHRDLATTFRALAARGVEVLLSNSDTSLVRELYADFRIDEVLCGRAVNSDGAGRAAVKELLISSASNSRMGIRP